MIELLVGYIAISVIVFAVTRKKNVSLLWFILCFRYFHNFFLQVLGGKNKSRGKKNEKRENDKLINLSLKKELLFIFVLGVIGLLIFV
ncbi:MAG: hypothetical protein FWD87_10410 [Spirochaetaceae bacterium]|nr:hypothetical protein [Spirochaetaceae bacterium]